MKNHALINLCAKCFISGIAAAAVVTTIVYLSVKHDTWLGPTIILSAVAAFMAGFLLTALYFLTRRGTDKKASIIGFVLFALVALGVTVYYWGFRQPDPCPLVGAQDGIVTRFLPAECSN